MAIGAYPEQYKNGQETGRNGRFNVANYSEQAAEQSYMYALEDGTTRIIVSPDMSTLAYNQHYPNRLSLALGLTYSILLMNRYTSAKFDYNPLIEKTPEFLLRSMSSNMGVYDIIPNPSEALITGFRELHDYNIRNRKLPQNLEQTTPFFIGSASSGALNGEKSINDKMSDFPLLQQTLAKLSFDRRRSPANATNASALLFLGRQTSFKLPDAFYEGGVNSIPTRLRDGRNILTSSVGLVARKPYHEIQQAVFVAQNDQIAKYYKAGNEPDSEDHNWVGFKYDAATGMVGLYEKEGWSEVLTGKRYRIENLSDLSKVLGTVGMEIEEANLQLAINYAASFALLIGTILESTATPVNINLLREEFGIDTGDKRQTQDKVLVMNDNEYVRLLVGEFIQIAAYLKPEDIKLIRNLGWRQIDNVNESLAAVDIRNPLLRNDPELARRVSVAKMLQYKREFGQHFEEGSRSVLY